MKYSLSSHSYAFNRRSKEGDWICLKCANYNYSFRQLCNRCQQQDRELNEHWLNLLGVVHYGELSFPSALFLNSENNLYYQNHQESQENPELPSSVQPLTIPINEYPSISPPEPPLTSLKLKSRPMEGGGDKRVRSGGAARGGQVQRGGEEQLSCGKWINELLD